MTTMQVVVLEAAHPVVQPSVSALHDLVAGIVLRMPSPGKQPRRWDSLWRARQPAGC